MRVLTFTIICILTLAFVVVFSNAAEIKKQVNIGNSDGGSTCSDLTGKKCEPSLPILPVLPGRGVDGLLNIEMGQVIEICYDKCKTTDDGRYLIPDNTYGIPVKRSDLGITSELFEHISNYSDATYSGINLEASYSGWFAQVSGKFSADYQEFKQQQVDTKSITSRVSFRTTIYVVGMEPDVKIHPTLHKLLMDVLKELQEATKYTGNDTISNMVAHNRSDFLLELIIRDYGQIVLTRIDAGAILMKEDFIDSNFASSSDENKKTIKISASASFLKLFQFDASYTSSVDTKTMESFEKYKTASNIKSIGGNLIKPNNMSINQWIDSIPTNLVPIQRKGDPIHFIIRPELFPPTIDLSLLNQLSLGLKAASDRYYIKNAKIGCMKPNLLNFDYAANIHNEHLCGNPQHNYTLGGIFQKCTAAYSGNGDLCQQMSAAGFPDRPNPATGDFTCPSNYHVVELKQKTIQTSSRRCSGWWFFKSCEDYNSLAYVTAYWCAAIHKPTTNTSSTDLGVMFGGIFTSKISNSITGGKNCPPTFVDITILGDLHICIGNDDAGYQFSVPFGGFFSCSNGNPLYTELKQVTMGQSTLLKGGNGLLAATTGKDDSYAHSCPPGYTQHVADVFEWCEILYCVKGDLVESHGRIPVQRPPFHEISTLFVPIPGGDNSGAGGSSSSSGYWIGLIIANVLIAIVTFVGCWVCFWNKRQSRQGRNTYQEIPNATFDETDPILSASGQHGSINAGVVPGGTAIQV